MSKPKRTFTAEFKRDAIALAEHGDRSIAQIERDLTQFNASAIACSVVIAAPFDHAISYATSPS